MTQKISTIKKIGFLLIMCLFATSISFAQAKPQAKPQPKPKPQPVAKPSEKQNSKPQPKPKPQVKQEPQTTISTTEQTENKTITPVSNTSKTSSTTTTSSASVYNGHEYVDLGLQSGTLWASCNVGATKPEDKGNLYAWGETTPKDSYTWSNYSFAKGSSGGDADNYAKYNWNDGKTTLEATDDVANKEWGGSWFIPNYDEFMELYDNCTWTWSTQNGVNGYKVTGKNNNSIFFPVTEKPDNAPNGRGIYWTSHFEPDLAFSNALVFKNDGSDYVSGHLRYMGAAVRPIYNPNKRIGKVANSDTGYSSLLPAEEESHELVNGHDYVYLGLPSGTRWATCNLGANKPSEKGNQFAWGETKTKSEFNGETYKGYKYDAVKDEDYLEKYNETDGKTILEAIDDAATVNWGGNWRTPTMVEFQELFDYCIWEWTTIDNVPGYKIISTINQKYIFLPSTFHFVPSDENDDRYLVEFFKGEYMTATLDRPYYSYSCVIEADSEAYKELTLIYRFLGLYIRPVCPQK